MPQRCRRPRGEPLVRRLVPPSVPAPPAAAALPAAAAAARPAGSRRCRPAGPGCRARWPAAAPARRRRRLRGRQGRGGRCIAADDHAHMQSIHRLYALRTPAAQERATQGAAVRTSGGPPRRLLLLACLPRPPPAGQVRLPHIQPRGARGRARCSVSASSGAATGHRTAHAGGAGGCYADWLLRRRRRS